MKRTTLIPGFFISILFLLFSCKQDQQDRLFTSVQQASSGITFVNEIHDKDSSFSFINEFGYMGGGVGIGDFNNDGLKDIFFTGNQVSCQLYINKGKNVFTDITEKAGLITDAWCTGVNVADVNQDGFDDLYICVFGKDLKTRSKNLLYINQGDLTFRESASEYGLADSGFSTQSVFLDFDRDGDLDLYLVNYLLSTHNSNTIYHRDKTGFSPANDRLYRNDGDSAHTGHPVFTDISARAGIREDGYGLGVSVADFNSDGWPDIYVANDFVSNDLLWLNQKDGTFANCIDQSLRHQSYSSMGSDAADLNNDLLTDLVTLDMLPEINERKKTSYSMMNYERFESERRMGYEPEFMRNMLQLNNGNSQPGAKDVPFFSEIGRLAGIEATDWSWSVLLADFNNDGLKDIHITNGIGRDFINADFLEFSSNISNSVHGKEDRQTAIRQKLASLDNINLPNYLYLNNADLGFIDYSEEAGINEPSMSNGAAYADLDNDGDLDLVTNNINKPAFLFINNTSNGTGKSDHHFLKLRLRGDSLNRSGFGSRLFLYQKGAMQLLEQNPVRGYFSSVDQELFFGLGKDSDVDSLVIVWPDGNRELLNHPPADTSLVLDYARSTTHVEENAGASQLVTGITEALQIFTEITGTLGINYQHQENPFNDYVLQRLLPQKFSQLGPFISVADINGDGDKDFFIGGAFNFSGDVFTQQKKGTFSGKKLTDTIKFEEDQNTLFFDADQDGDQDLLVTGGGMQYEENSPYYHPRLYLNNGNAGFRLDNNAIPDQVRTMAGCVSAGDFDGDGDDDLFVGGRVSAKYPLSPKSFLLRNDNGVFNDVTADVCPALQAPGMLTAAVWTDYDQDGMVDLVIAGEWMPVRFFKNNSKQLTEVTATTGLLEMNGMWRSLLATDVDNDGDTDFIAGNLGLNCEYRVSPSEPMELFATDMDNNGSIDPFLFYYISDGSGQKRSYPASGRGRLAEQVPALKKKFLLNSDFARASYEDIFKGGKTEGMMKFVCEETRSCYLENTGNGKFVKHLLPVHAQFAPVNAIICEDFNNDGWMDLLLAGNEYQNEVMTGSYDASYGCLLLGNKARQFRAVPFRESGIKINGDVKSMAVLTLHDGSRILLAAVNNDSLRVFRLNQATDLSRFKSKGLK